MIPRHLPRKLAPLDAVPAARASREHDVTPAGNDPTFLAWVRRRACCAPTVEIPCEGRIEVHHWPARGRAKRGDDRRTVPLCRRHHALFHARGSLAPFDALATRELFLREQLGQLIAYLDAVVVDDGSEF